jgi:large subunit ribosomal protein L29
MKAAELRSKSEHELREAAEKLRAELYDVRFRREVDQVADLNVLKRTRRDLARVLTVLSERKLGLATGGTKV